MPASTRILGVLGRTALHPIFCLLFMLACARTSTPTIEPALMVADADRSTAPAEVPSAPPGPAYNQIEVGDIDDPMFAYTEPGELPQIDVLGELERSTLPLEHTDVAAEVRGHVAQVRVRQRFVNDRPRPIEVRYTFPLPENAAVDGMRMIIGARVIESEVLTRDQARQTYEQARNEGHTAALLEQERPNIFTQSVANIAAGEAIEVELTYLQTLSQDGGTSEFVFPMVVGPRFSPPGVSDAARISPPVVGKGQRSGNDVSLSLRVQAGAAIDRWDAPTHTVVGAATADGFSVRLADAETIPNRDFVLRWQAVGAQAQATLFLGPVGADGRGHFSLLIDPPAVDLDALVGRREMIFVIDRSGSMSGLPLALAKQTLRQALARLRPVDTFDVVGFESGTERLFTSPRPANEHNLMLAERFIDGMQAGGGTMMAGAVEAALSPEVAPGRHRYVFFLTDGYIGNEGEIFTGARALLRRAEQAGSRARVFAIGIGSAPNRELLAGLAKAGEGTDLYVSNREHPQLAVDRYYRYVDHGVLEDLRVDWGGLEVESTFPSRLPDLYASHAVIVLGRYREPRAAVAPAVSGKRVGGHLRETLAVQIVRSSEDDRALETLWARAEIDDLYARFYDDVLDSGQLERRVTSLGLRHHLVTAYTSLVAVDHSRVVGDGDPDFVQQAVDAPEDVDPVMAGAHFVPAASRDTAGITLAGTTGAESRYTVDGANVSSPSLGTVSASVSRDFSQTVVVAAREIQLSGGGGLLGPTSWPEEARLRVRKLEAGEGADARRLRKAVKLRAGMFEACYVQHRVQGKRRLGLRLRFDAAGQLTDIELVSGSLGSAAADGCISAVLTGVPWAGLGKGATTVELLLVLE